MHYLLEGRIIPERIDLNFPEFRVESLLEDGKKLSIVAYVIKSKIFIHVHSDQEESYATIRNIMFTIVGDVVNYAGFQHVLGISYELDSITDVEKQSTYVFGVEGFVFENTDEFGNRITFTQNKYGSPLTVNVALLTDPAISRATFELRNSIRYPDFTALHCRLAIEAVRNAFDAEDESKGWKALRENLNVNRETIESFKEIATNQRHGKNEHQTWEQRQHCMQIAWEVVYRYTKYRESDPPKTLSVPEL